MTPRALTAEEQAEVERLDALAWDTDATEFKEAVAALVRRLGDAERGMETIAERAEQMHSNAIVRLTIERDEARRLLAEHAAVPVRRTPDFFSWVVQWATRTSTAGRRRTP